MKKGIYIVESYFNQIFQIAAFETKEQAEKCSKEWNEQYLKRKRFHESWVTFYKFGEKFNLD